MSCAQRLAFFGSIWLSAALSGCAQPSDTPSASQSNLQTSPVSPADQTKVQTPDAPAARTTPTRSVDTASVVDVVKAEVKGGESESASPASVLWLFPDTALIHDEPMSVEVPKGFPELIPGSVVPLSNPITKGKYELGRQLFFDPRVSKNGTVSCATCHDPAKGWTDRMPTSVGIQGQIGSRNAPTVINTAYGKSLFWDGRAPTLEAQVQGPVQNKIEMGDQSYAEIVERLRKIPAYAAQFKKVFGTDVTLDGIAKAIATFERVAALSGDSAYDRYRDYDNPDRNTALTDSQKRGMVLAGEMLNDDDEFTTDVVRQKAKCTVCHVGFNFTDEKFHNLGVGYEPATGKFSDPGRFGVAAVGAKDLADLGAFKTPTMRDLGETGPYMHDGSESTLEEVVEFYNKGGNPNPYLDKDMQPLNLSDQEKVDVVAFLKGLNGVRKPIEHPLLPPGPDGTIPDSRAALVPPTKDVATGDPHGVMTVR